MKRRNDYLNKLIINSNNQTASNSCSSSDASLHATPSPSSSSSSPLLPKKLNKTVSSFAFSKLKPKADHAPAQLPLRPNPLDLDQKMDLACKLLDNSELLFNSAQLINFVEFYFEDPATVPLGPPPLPPLAHAKTSANEEASKQLVSTCFPCIVCSMQFSFDQTFHLHLDRRSVMIRLYCVKCDAFKTFYNKCKLLYHVYSHKMSLFEPIYKSVRIESIPAERSLINKERSIDFDCIFANISALMSRNGENVAKNGLNMINNGYEIGEKDIAEVNAFLKHLLANKFVLFKCLVCEALFFDLSSLKVHFVKSQKLDMSHSFFAQQQEAEAQGKQKVSARSNFKTLKLKYSSSFNKSAFAFVHEDAYSQKSSKQQALDERARNEWFAGLLNCFSYKKLKFSTRCSTLASMSLINSKFQFYEEQSGETTASKRLNEALICPECGLSFDARTQTDKFRQHLIYDCLFTIKYDFTQIKCPANECKQVFETIQDSITHWLSSHTVKQHQCELCDKKGEAYVFGSDASSDPAAPNEPNILKQILNEYECNSTGMPPSVISDLNKHYAEKHRGSQVALKLAFKCLCKDLTCFSQVGNGSGSNTDLNEGLDNGDGGGNGGGECSFTQMKNLRKHIVSLLAKSIVSFNCLMCQKMISNDKYQSHLKSDHGLDKICICPICGLLKKLVYFCFIFRCSENFFSNFKK
jgi:hypothetical protein